MKTPTQSERADFRAFCRNATNQQLEVIYYRELNAFRYAYADEAKAEADSRGITL
jgi:hypothetical protein